MAGTQKPMPIGVEDFKKLRESYYFVDKTRFIRELVDNHGEVTLITRPRRFGKTLGLSMLRYFFTLKKAEANRALFEGLAIERAGNRYMAEQGTRPVVFLTLKDIRARDCGTMLEKLSEVLRQLYRQFRYLGTSPAVDPTDRQYFSAVMSTACDAGKLQFALSNLMSQLEQHHGRKAVLLLDEYDAPIQAAWEYGYYGECIEFMRGFLGSALKTNDALDFAVLTGVLRISKESIFSGLNNLRVCSVLAEQYSDAFGFTQEEAAQLMEDCGAKDKLPELRKWYDGYRFGAAEIYNPWSVIQYVGNGCKFGAYWVNVSGNGILNVMLECVDARRKRELERLLDGEPVSIVIQEGVVYSEIRDSRDALYMILLATGYLKAVDVVQEAEEDARCSLLIPNREVRGAYRRKILAKLASRNGETMLREMLDAMAAGDTRLFEEDLAAVLRDNVSYHDTSHAESFYHGLMLGFSVLMEGAYRVESNREAGYGRFGIAFFPLRDGSPGVILELKAARSEQEMERLAKDGLRQIDAKAYPAEMSRQGAKEVWKYGIAFCGKRVWMERGQDFAHLR